MFIYANLTFCPCHSHVLVDSSRSGEFRSLALDCAERRWQHWLILAAYTFKFAFTNEDAPELRLVLPRTLPMSTGPTLQSSSQGRVYWVPSAVLKPRSPHPTSSKAVSVKSA